MFSIKTTGSNRVNFLINLNPENKDLQERCNFAKMLANKGLRGASLHVVMAQRGYGAE